MTKNNRDAADQLTGLIVHDDSSLIEKAHLKRHPRHRSYIPASEVKPLTDSEADAYEALNQKLHDGLRAVSKMHFKDTPVPKALKKDNYFTPFTYQNYDWYGPSYECYIMVIGAYVTPELLKKFQALLVDDLRDWCIRVVVSESYAFDNDHEIAIFSDQVLVPLSAAKALGIPTP